MIKIKKDKIRKIKETSLLETVIATRDDHSCQ